MRLRFLPILLVGLLCTQIAQAAPSVPAEVREADDSVITGNLVAAHNGTLTIEITKGPTTQTTKIDLADLAQVIIHAPTAPAPKPPARSPNPRRRARQANNSANPLAPTTQPTPTTEPASRPTDSITWHLKLADGDHFNATVTQWSDDLLEIKSDAITNQSSLKIPTDQLLELWCGSADAIKKAIALNVAADQDDIAFVQSSDNIVTVHGSALGIAGDDLRFQYSGNERKISLTRLVGILFTPKAPPQSPATLRQLVKLQSGETLSGNWTGLTANAVRLRTPWHEIAAIPLARIATIDTINGRLVFLSDLTPSKVEQTPFFTRVIPFRLDTALDGGPLTLSDGAYTKGIAMHARCVLQYDINGNFTRFRSKVGLEQPAGHIGRTIIRLLADDKPIYENADFHGDQPPQDLDLNITGVKQLTLIADFGPSQDAGARVIWANARLLRPKTIATTNPS